MRYVFDVETNGLLNSLSKIHCLVLINIDTEKVLSFRPNEVEVGLQLLSDAKLICGHNIINFYTSNQEGISKVDQSKSCRHYCLFETYLVRYKE